MRTQLRKRMRTGHMALLEAHEMRTGGNIPTEVYFDDIPLGSSKFRMPRIVS
jgi:hypothetical protein